MKQEDLNDLIRRHINPDKLGKLTQNTLHLLIILQGSREILYHSKEFLKDDPLRIADVFVKKSNSFFNKENQIDADKAYYISLCIWANLIYENNKLIFKTAQESIDKYISLLRDTKKVSTTGTSVLDNQLSNYKTLLAHMGILGASHILFCNKKLKRFLIAYYQNKLTFEKLKECLNNQILILEEISTFFKSNKPYEAIMLLLTFELSHTIERNSIVIEKMNNQ